MAEKSLTLFTPIYVHKVIERKIEMRYDNNGNPVRTMYETLVEEFNPCLIQSFQQRIAELEDQISNAPPTDLTVGNLCGIMIVAIELYKLYNNK